jgi:exonuclease III
MLHIILRGCWCDVIVLNVHAPTEYKIDDVKGRFYEELEHVFHIYPECHMKILLGDFNVKVSKEDILEQRIGNESVHEISNNNGVRIINFATSKSVKSTTFPYHNIDKFTWTSPDGKTCSQIDHISIDRIWHSNVLDV